MYDSKCLECGETFTTFRRMADCDDLPMCCDQRTARVYNVPMFIPDIQPYRAVVIDKKTGEVPVIGSRAEHREFLKRNQLRNYEPSSEKREVQGDFNVKDALIKATNKVLG
jgi:hypothetical protein